MNLQELKSTIDGIEETEAWKADNQASTDASPSVTAVFSEREKPPSTVSLQSSLGVPTPQPPQNKPYREYKFTNQFNALFRKSLSSQKRQYKMNCCQVLFPLFLIFFLFLIQLLVTQIIDDKFGPTSPAVFSPQFTPNPIGIPTPTEGLSSFDDFCTGNAPLDPSYLVNFAYSTNNISDILIAGSNNPLLGLFGFYQTDFKVLFECILKPALFRMNYTYYNDSTALQSAIYQNWVTRPSMACAVDVTDINTTLSNLTLNFTLFYNDTHSSGYDMGAYVNILVQGLLRYVYSNPTLVLMFAGWMDFPTVETRNYYDIISDFGPSFYIFIFQMLLPLYMFTVVKEKESGIREIMKMMGLKNHVYWLVTYLFFLALYVVCSALSVCFACALGFKVFLANNPLTYLLLLFIWGNTLISLSLFLSAFFANARSGLVFGYIILVLSGILGSNLMVQIFDSQYVSSAAKTAVMIVPQFAFFRGLYALRNAVVFNQYPGMQISEISHPDYALNEVYIALTIEWFVFLVLALYLDMVLPIGPGSKKSPFFIFMWPATLWRRYRMGLNSEFELTQKKTVQVVDLCKIYRKKMIVNHLNLSMYSQECLGFIGPNGAGKSTTVKLISGYARRTSGSVRILGMTLEDDLDKIRLQTGICPQDNVLWDELTAKEHLLFFARIKGLEGQELEDAVTLWLDKVQLAKAKHKTSKQFSGGMKRRLCVAIAMVAAPHIVLLDEPTTGLDPDSKSNLWDVILEFKKYSSILLTTHCMEEAERLCDRIAIFISGNLAVLGTADELTSTYGKGFKIKTSHLNRPCLTALAANPSTCGLVVKETDTAANDSIGEGGSNANVIQEPVVVRALDCTSLRERVHAFVMQLPGDAQLISTSNGTHVYELNKDVHLSHIFEEINRAGFSDYLEVSNTNLEEIFLYYVQKQNDKSVEITRCCDVKVQTDCEKEVI